ncbi:hypothetical protein NBRC116187_29030 [Halopseudomonas sabulinigri]|uniref:Uncharacterized protein n=1 Tax=Halopseudomonas sabulinigri TaxID=472181 RepID=A0ABP9ZSV3_9GAMM
MGQAMIIHPHQPEPPQADPQLQMLATPPPPRERLEFYRREIFNETGNLSSRTNAYLTA